MQRPIRFLLSKDGQGHMRGVYVVADTLREAGFEVILGGYQPPNQIVETAIQEDADIIGYRFMEAAPSVLIPILLKKMKEKGIQGTPVVVGGIIPEDDEVLIRKLGVKDVFHPFTPLDKIVESIRKIGEGIASRN